MPEEFRGVDAISVSFPSNLGIENINNIFDGNSNTFARVYSTDSVPSGYYNYFYIVAKLPPTLRFHGVKLKAAVASSRITFRPLLCVVKSYPYNVTEGSWSPNIIFSSYTPFRSVGEGRLASSRITNSVFPPTTSLTLTEWDISVEDGDAAFIGGSSIPSSPSIIPSRYRILTEEQTTTNGGTIIIGGEIYTTSNISQGTSLLYIYDFYVKIPSSTGDWYYYLPSTNSVVSVTQTLTDQNLATSVDGLNRTSKILFVLFPKSGMNFEKLSMYVASETGSNLTIQVYGDTNFDFTGQPVTTFVATPSGEWITLENVTINHALQFVPST